MDDALKVFWENASQGKGYNDCLAAYEGVTHSNKHPDDNSNNRTARKLEMHKIRTQNRDIGGIIEKPNCEHSNQQPGQPCPDCVRFSNSLFRS